MITRYKKRSILDGYFNPLVFWYQWDYLRSPAKIFSFVGRVSKIGTETRLYDQLIVKKK